MVVIDDPPQVRIVATDMTVEDIEEATDAVLGRHPECTTVEYLEVDGDYVIVFNLARVMASSG